jgi:hypothetical protein
MPIDLEYLRQRYASLSDEALLEIDPADLVETARKCYDDELGRRELASRRGVPRADGEPPGAGDKPDWLEEATAVYSRADSPGLAPAPEVANARDALEAAGIPCYLDLYEIPEEKDASREPTHEWRLMAPGNLNLRATSVLERDIFNAEFEAEWKTHLETLSDEDLRAMKPKVAFCGLFDRIERVTRAYDKEIARRRLESESA